MAESLDAVVGEYFSFHGLACEGKCSTSKSTLEKCVRCTFTNESRNDAFTAA
jgi:hypothetical protein